ncbi:MAG: CoA-binding protein [Erysipelotrichaceae bacterium]|nr:CoA-binding protein [Erysipelotrichaceae bacterium]
MNSLEILKKSQTFAVIGVTTNHEKFGFRIYDCLKSLNKTVYGVTPIYKEVDGDLMYASLSDIPDQIEVAVFVVSKKYSLDYMKEAKALKIPYIWMQPGTYDEDYLKTLADMDLNVITDCVLVQSKNL